MEKKTIGAFIAALRKANGMTQQELADNLHVSNKAVSRWEREECSPDISLIPVIAEIFGVTCDELLRGERIKETARDTKSDARAEKQLRWLVNRTIQKFKNLIFIAIALALSGYIVMIGLAYAFFLPTLGFALMRLFEVAAAVVTLIAANSMKQCRMDNEIFDTADEKFVYRYDRILGYYTFSALFSILAVIVISLPHICFDFGFVNAVLSLESYLRYLARFAFALLLPAWLLRKRLASLISGRDLGYKKPDMTEILLDSVQLGASTMSAVLFTLAPYAANDYDSVSVWYYILISLAFVMLAVNLAGFVFYTVKKKTESIRHFVISLRNLLTIPSALIISNWHSFGFILEPESNHIRRYDLWDSSALWGAVIIYFIVFIIFNIVEKNVEKQ